MKLVHISDLHLGKRVNEYPMLEDQRYILMKILNIIDNEHPDALLIAGDVYDKSVPSAEAVQLFDDFLVRLAERKLAVFIISGNHDSPERLAFGSRLIDLSGIHLAPVYNGEIKPFALDDEYGRVNIYMLPFVKPVNVKQFLPESEIMSYTDAIHAAVDNMQIDISERNVLVTHQFVTGAQRSESEEISVGGSDNVDASVFDGFDYVALGHIHGPQNIGSERVRYCGSPLKYSFSEVSQTKSVTVVELQNKGELTVRMVPLVPKYEMRELKGTYSELTMRDFYQNTTYTEDYTHIILTDEEDIPEALAKLRVIYHRLMKLDYCNKRTRGIADFSDVNDTVSKTPFELFSELYQKQNASPMSAEQSEYISELIEEIWEGER